MTEDVKSEYARELLQAIDTERVVRASSFHLRTEKLLDFDVVPLTLRKYSLLRLLNSPFIPPFDTPSPIDLAQFLWVMSPQFDANDSQAKSAFFRRCRGFIQPAPPRLRMLRWLWKSRCMDASIYEAALVDAARAFVAEAMQDRPEPVNAGLEAPAYYCDEIGLCAALGREHHFEESSVIEMPLKRIFQYLKEIRDRDAAKAGQYALLCNPSDRVKDKYLEAANRKN